MITQAVCASFKAELAQAMHNFTTTSGHVFKMALFTSAATLIHQPPLMQQLTKLLVLDTLLVVLLGLQLRI